MARKKTNGKTIALAVLVAAVCAQFLVVFGLLSGWLALPRFEFPEFPVGPYFPRVGENRERENIAPYEAQILALVGNFKPGIVTVGPPIGEIGGGGTGFIIHENGYVLTNAHVVENRSVFSVITIGGENYTADVVAVENKEVADVALLRVRDLMSNVRVLTFDNSRRLRDKDIVFSIGHPMVFGSWVITAGEFVAQEYYSTTLYIDKPGGSGESGSPLFDMQGKVVGIIYGGTTMAGRPLITAEDNLVVWWGNSEKYRNEVAMANDTDSIYNFLVKNLGKELADELFKR